MKDREAIFKSKADFHKQMAKLPFEEKIRIMKRLQRVSRYIERSSQR